MRLRAADPARVATPLAIGLGLAALATRQPSRWAVLVTVGVGAVGLIAPLPSGPREVSAAAARPGSSRPSAGTWLGAVALGVGALLLAGRLPSMLGIGPPAGVLVPHAGVAAVTASVVAAVAEELFFRRLVFGWLAVCFGAGGPAVAVCGSALAFAAVHVPVYGLAVLPIDAAAGALLGWQRWITGGWSASGLTHVVANLIAEGVIA
ncbi:MAG TPA: CPBP family intramembrane glutamic endopeptidase [Actinomycetota bacterium]|nr:CPBP family intramembrane glutamic endopeptidase [Actinomycetota bacterium]